MFNFYISLAIIKQFSVYNSSLDSRVRLRVKTLNENADLSNYHSNTVHDFSIYEKKAFPFSNSPVSIYTLSQCLPRKICIQYATTDQLPV